MFIFLFLLSLCSPQIFSAAASDPEAKEDLAAPAPMSQEQFFAALGAISGVMSNGAIISINQVKPEHYQVFINAADVLSAGVDGDDADDLKEMIPWTLAELDPPLYQNPAFVAAAAAFSAGFTSSAQKSIVFHCLATVNPEHYQTCIGALKALGADLNQNLRRSIATTIVKNPSSLNAARALLFTRWMERGAESSQRTIQVLETRLDSPVPPLQAEFAPGVNPYAQGMNVHAAGRDQKTQEAFKLLLSLWAPSDSEVAQYSQAFMNYTTSQNATDAAVANRVLLGIGRKTHDFGGLLQAKGLLIQGEMILPRTLLAHLWHFVTISFAEVATDPKEVENAKKSIISALRDSIETDNHVVCDPGKLQRLASILQGRLEGAKIDSHGMGIPKGTPLVLVNPALLPQPADVQLMGAAAAAAPAPVPAGPQYIRDVNVIQNHMNELDRKWQAITPATAEEMLRDTFEYLEELKRVDILLDPRDVTFYLIFGTCKTHNGPGGKFRLNPDYGPFADMEDMFKLGDYIDQYGQREQEAFAAIQAQQQPAAAAAAPMPHQDQAAAAGAGAMRVQGGNKQR